MSIQCSKGIQTGMHYLMAIKLAVRAAELVHLPPLCHLHLCILSEQGITPAQRPDMSKLYIACTHPGYSSDYNM